MSGLKPSDWPFRGVVFLAVLLFFPLLISPAHAQVKGIATLEDFGGDIIIKNNGKWGATCVKGLILYNGDKVVTRKGTAHVIFHDGSELNIEPNSNVRIIEEVLTKGFIFKKMVNHRRIRVLLGKTRYREEYSKGRKTRFEAPTGIVVLGGTEISFGVDYMGTAFSVIMDGNWYTLGDVIAGEAPDLLQEFADNSLPQRFALVAAEAAIQGAVAASRASMAAATAVGADATVTDKLNKVKEEVKAAKAIIEQALASAKESKLEAEMMAKNADPSIVKEALEAINVSDSAMTAMATAGTAANNAAEATTKIVEVAKKAIKEKNAAGLNGVLEAAKAEAKVAHAHAGVAEGFQAIVDAQTAGGTQVAKAMEEKVRVTIELAAKSIKLRMTATQNANKAAEVTWYEAEAFAQAAKASASAASVLNATVQVNTAGIIATVAGDNQKAEEAFEASEKAAQTADMAFNFAEKAADAAESGKLAHAVLAADSAESLEAKTEELSENVIRSILEEGPLKEPEQAPLEGEDEPPPEEGDKALPEEPDEIS